MHPIRRGKRAEANGVVVSWGRREGRLEAPALDDPAGEAQEEEEEEEWSRGPCKSKGGDLGVGADPDGPWNLSLEWGCRQVEGPGMATFWDPQTRCRGPGCGNFVGGRREGEA